ncbi:MAG: hypothetical protein RBR82_15160 [Pseudomonas sp.]|nr:hypothetical protein [Pseudomonas sp.]
MLKKWLNEFLKELSNDFKESFSYIKKGLTIWRLRKIKRKAMRLHRKHNQQFFVLKIMGRVRIISKQGFKNLRQHGKLPMAMTATRLKQISLFYTPARYDKKRV